MRLSRSARMGHLLLAWVACRVTFATSTKRALRSLRGLPLVSGLVAAPAGTPLFAQNPPATQAAVGATCRSPAPLVALVANHARRYPGLEPTDVYKLLHHATRGSEHAVHDTAAARRWMRDEIRDLNARPTTLVEPVVDTLADGGFARINLRPFLARGGDAETLLGAFVRTSTAAGDVVMLHCAGAALLSAARRGIIALDADALAALFDRQRASGDGAVHHSRAYGERYRPAYRVVHVRELPGLLETLRKAR